MKINIIAAMDRNQVIGFMGEIPWYIPDDLTHFRNAVDGYILICGRKTFETLPSKFHNKFTIVLSSQLFIDNCTVARNMFDAIKKAKQLIKAENKPNEVFVVGGGEVFKEAVGMADKLVLSYVKGNYLGDTFFPEVNYHKWQATSVQENKDFKIITWKRK